MRDSLSGHVPSSAAHHMRDVAIFDNVLSPSTLFKLRRLLGSSHSATIFDRHERSSNRTRSSRRSWSDLEHVVDSLLTELGDSSRYAELWARSRWSNLGLHRDLDEPLVRRECGRQRSPFNAHVLYVAVARGQSAPTAVFREAGPPPPNRTVTGGAPHRLDGVLVVPAVRGRLLRFAGSRLHAVPAPRLQWLGSAECLETMDPSDLTRYERRVVLFNTWGDPTLHGAYGRARGARRAATPTSVRGGRLGRRSFTTATRATARRGHTGSRTHLPDAEQTGSSRIRCEPRAAWSPVTVQTASPEEHSTEGPRLPITLPMMGTRCRRDCEQRNLTSIAALSRLRAALLAPTQPTLVSLGQPRRELSASLQVGDGERACTAVDAAEGGRGANVPANISVGDCYCMCDCRCARPAHPSPFIT